MTLVKRVHWLKHQNRWAFKELSIAVDGRVGEDMKMPGGETWCGKDVINSKGLNLTSLQ